MTTEKDRAPLSTEVSPQHDPSENPVRAGATATDERLTIGARLSGRYRIERELGEGGMGVVYLVSDEQVAGEIFAVKVLKEGCDPKVLSLLMEYLEGKSLNVLLDEEFGRVCPSATPGRLSRTWGQHRVTRTTTT